MVDAWTLEQGAFAVAAESAADVAAAVDFAREHNLRLVVRGGGHSYLGTSNSRDSLLIWTRRMAGIELQARCDVAGRPATDRFQQHGAQTRVQSTCIFPASRENTGNFA